MNKTDCRPTQKQRAQEFKHAAKSYSVIHAILRVVQVYIQNCMKTCPKLEQLNSCNMIMKMIYLVHENLVPIKSILQRGNLLKFSKLKTFQVNP